MYIYSARGYFVIVAAVIGLQRVPEDGPELVCLQESSQFLGFSSNPHVVSCGSSLGLSQGDSSVEGGAVCGP